MLDTITGLFNNWYISGLGMEIPSKFWGSAPQLIEMFSNFEQI